MLVFQVIGRLGSNSVSTSLRERRSSAIFPKRCNAGGQAGSSGLGLPGVWLGGERCRWVRLSRPALSPSDVVLYGVGPFAGRARWGGPGILALPVGGSPGFHISYLRHEAWVGLWSYRHFAPMGHWLWWVCWGGVLGRALPLGYTLRVGCPWSMP
jgi:hypothetical protein